MERLKKYLQARIQFELIDNTDDIARLDELGREINRHAEWFLEANKPKDFNPFTENVLIRMEQEFESMAAALSENGIQNAADLTVFEFYSRVKYFEAKSQKK